MEKITKEELQEKLFGTQLSDDDLEKVSGGIGIEEIQNCTKSCQDLARRLGSAAYNACIGSCL